ncbi:leucokinins-like [Anopheles nili]|uniref:leucokinins-like n=1 Tax=Anopheles nili TaxID=185578 RepID=UPI00237BF7D0|nr:leucokinins-like [Anopheles nili]
MAMFCLFLAAAAFVLAGGPRACRCDRPRVSGDVFRATVNDEGLDGSFWSNILGRNLERQRLEDGNNLIPAAKPIHGVPLVPCYSARETPNELMDLESLINRYRKFIVEKLIRHDDACYWLGRGRAIAENDEESSPTLGSHTESTEVSPGRSTNGPLDSTGGAASYKTPDGLQRDARMPDTMNYRQLRVDPCLSNAKQYYYCLSSHIDDQQLLKTLHDYLDANCDLTDSAGHNTLLQKRDTPRYVSKQKFHSWGGKRNNAQVFYPWGGKRTVVRPHKQPKVVIRNPFHSWGGKRSGLADYSAA